LSTRETEITKIDEFLQIKIFQVLLGLFISINNREK